MRPLTAKKTAWLGLASLVMLLLALPGLPGCGQVFLDPGPNPARIRVKLWAKVPERLKNYSREWIYWDWGLNLVKAKGPDPMLPPTVKQNFDTISNTNPLVRDTTFLAPPGKHKYLLQAYGYANREQGEHAGPVILLRHTEILELDLPPGGSYTIERRLGGD